MTCGAGELSFERFIDQKLPVISAAQQAVLESPSPEEEINKRSLSAHTAINMLEFIESLYPELEGGSDWFLDNAKAFVAEERAHWDNLPLLVREETTEELRRRHFLAAVIADVNGAEYLSDHHQTAFKRIKGPKGIVLRGLSFTGEVRDPYEIYFDAENQKARDEILAVSILLGANYPISDKSVERNVASQIKDPLCASMVFMELCCRGDAGSLKPLEDLLEKEVEDFMSNPDFNLSSALHLRKELETAIALIEEAPIPVRAIRTIKAANKLLEPMLPYMANKCESDTSLSDSQE